MKKEDSSLGYEKRYEDMIPARVPMLTTAMNKKN